MTKATLAPTHSLIGTTEDVTCTFEHFKLCSDFWHLDGIPRSAPPLWKDDSGQKGELPAAVIDRILKFPNSKHLWYRGLPCQ